jgi:hypothetical protein
VEEQWAADFVGRTFVALQEVDQTALTQAYLNAKLSETDAGSDEEG